MFVIFFDEYNEQLLETQSDVPNKGDSVEIDDETYYVKTISWKYGKHTSVEIVLTDSPVKEDRTVNESVVNVTSGVAEKLATQALKETKSLRNEVSVIRNFIKRQKPNK